MTMEGEPRDDGPMTEENQLDESSKGTQQPDSTPPVDADALGTEASLSGELVLDRSIHSELEEAMAIAMLTEEEDPEAAMVAWQQAWQVSPGHPDVLEALTRLCERTGKWPPLADFLKKQGTGLQEEDRKINLLMSLARIYDTQMGQDVMAVNTYQAILKIRESYMPAINASIEKFEAMERWPDLVKMMKMKGAAVTAPEDKVAVWLVVAKIFLNRFSNQAETIKAFEEVLLADPYHPEAIAYLKDMYEKRRDWEKMIGLMENENSQIISEVEKVTGLIQIAELTSERIKKPALCIERWEAVLKADSENTKALAQLSDLYDRAKEFEKLADVISRQLEFEDTEAVRAQMFQKLGQVYSDKIGDLPKAIVAWRSLLAINPDDRRAQEQLKKCYLDTQAWGDLEQFYEASGKWDEFIRVLEREADRPDLEVDKKIGMQFKIAELWQEKKSRVDRAARCYETILNLDPSNLEAAELFIPILEEGKDSTALANVLEVRLVHLQENDDKLALTRRIAAIAEGEIDDAQRAFKGFLAAFNLRPDEAQSSIDMERLAGTTNNWVTVVETYRSLMDQQEVGEESIDLTLKLARVLDEELNEQEEALTLYDGILSSDPKNSLAVAALEKLYAHMGRYEELLDIYARRLEMAEDDSERQEILYNQALLWEEEVEDNSKAIAVLQHLIEMAGDEIRSLSSLDRLYTAEEKWSDLADVITRQLALGVLEQSEVLELKYRLGQVSDRRLNNRGKALTCYREILSIEPDHQDAVMAIENLLEDEAQQAEAAAILAPFYEEREEWEKLVYAIEILVSRSSDEVEKYTLLCREGELFSERLMSPERAFVAYSRAFKSNPAEIHALERLEMMTSILDAWSEMVTLLAEGGQSAGDPDVSKDLWLRAAKIYEMQLDDVDKSIYAYNKTLDADPQNAEAVAALEGIYNRTERWTDLIDVYQTKIKITEDAEDKERIFLQMSLIYEEMLDSPEDAIGCLKEVLAFDPLNAGALKELDKLFVMLERWTDLADNLLQQLSLGEVEETVPLNLRLAELREKRLNEVGAAIEIYKEVLNLDPSNAVAIDALEQIIQVNEFRRDVADILEPIYDALGSWEKLIAVYEIMVETDTDTRRKVALLRRIAALYENEGDEPEKAFTTYGRALCVDPSDEQTQEELERLARVVMLFGELAALYNEVVQDMDNFELKAAYHLKIANIFEEKLHDVENAILHYRAVLEVDPTHLDAITALEGAYQITENYEELAITYLKKVEIIEDPDDQKEILFKASQIYQEILDNTDKAISVYRRILEIDEDDLKAITQLESLYLQLERWDDLQEVYNKKVDLVETPEEKREVLYVLGAMYESEVGDIDKAVITYQRVLEFEPDDTQAIHRLDILFSEKEEWHDLLSILEKEIELAADPDEAISFQYRVGDLYVRHLDDVNRAIEYFKEILDIAPDHQPSLDALEGLIDANRGPLQAAEVLEPIYQDMGEWRKLIAVLEVKLRYAADETEQVELLHRIAELLETDLHLGVPEEAFDVYARALAVEVLNEKTLYKLEELADLTGRWKDLAMLFDTQLEAITEADEAIPIGLKTGAIYEEKLGLPDEAILRYQRVLEFDDRNGEALLCLDQLFQRQARWIDLTEVLLKESQLVGEPEESLKLLFRMGQVYQQELEDTDKAIDVYRDILASDPTHESTATALELLFAEGVSRVEIAEVLEPIYQMHSEWEKLVGLYEARIQDTNDVKDRVVLMHSIAEIQEERALDAVEAFNWYCKAFAEDPSNERSQEDIERLAGTVDGWSELADLYQELFYKVEEKDIKALCAKRLAVVSEEQLGDVTRAEQAYRGCLELGDDDLDVLVALDRIYTQYVEWDRLTEILSKLAEIVQDKEEKIVYLNRLGTVLETELDEIERARHCFHAVIDELDPGHMDSLKHLEVIYADRESWQDLFDIYARMKAATESEEESADLYAKMATLASECLDDIPQSIELWGQVLELLGEDPVALEAMAELYSRQENWSDLVEILQRAVTVAEDDDAQVRIYSQMGLVWGECLGRDRNALENWQNVLSIDSENMPALKAIAGIREVNKEWTELLETLETIIQVGANTFGEEELKGYYSKQGTILADILNEPLDAIEAWRHAHEVDPRDLVPFEALENLYKGQEMWDDLVELLGDKSLLLEGEIRINTLLEQAETYEEKIEAPLKAKKSYMGILEVAPLHELAFEKLVDIETEEENWGELNQVYYDRLNHLRDIPQRIKILHNVADIFENKIKEPDNAFIVMLRAFEEDYLNDDTTDHLERLASVTNNWEQLLGAANQVLSVVKDKQVQISLCLKIGKWYADELGNPEYAIACYQRVLQLDNENATALTLTGNLYRANRQWNEYVDVLKRAVEFESDSEKRKALFVELGETYEEYLEDVNRARNAYQEALKIDPGLERASDALERIFVAAQNWRDLIPMLRRKREVLTNPEDIIFTHMRIGEIFEENLDEPQPAVQEYRKVLEINEGHATALKGLERLYTKLQRWPDLMDILEIQLEYATSERERIDLLIQIAGMLETEFVKPDKSAERYEEVLQIDPNHYETLEALERLYQQMTRWQDLIHTLERHIEATPARTEKIGFYEQMGAIWSSELDDADRAIQAYEEILDIVPDHQEALYELARLQEQNEDWAAAHKTLKTLVDTIDDAEHRIDLLYRLGIINEDKLRNRKAAIDYFRATVDLAPGHLPSLDALRKIYLDESEWVAAARIYEAEQEYTESDRTKSVLRYELGALYSSKLKEDEAAVEWYEKALQSDPDNQLAAEPLVDVYIDAARFQEAEPLLDMLIRLGANKRSSEEMQVLFRKLGLVADKLDNLDKSLQSYQTAYDMNTAHLSTLLKLADVYYRKEIWDKAFKFYQMVLVHHREKQKKHEIVEIFYRLGYIKAKVKERRKALNMFDKALEINPKHLPTLEQVIELHAEGKNFEQVIHYKKELFDAVESDEERFALLVDIGDIWQGNLRNPQKAISSYVEALQINANDRPVLHKVLPLYQSTKQWQKVVEIINRVAEMEENADKLGRLYYSMGVIFRDEIKSADEAVACFNKSLDASIENLKAFEAIDRILTQQKDWKNLERAYRKMLHRIAGQGRPDLEVNLWHFLGEIYRTRMNQFEPATEAFKMAAKLDPDNVMRHDILAELYVTLPNHLQDAINEYQWMIKHNPYNVDAYKALRKLYFDNRQFDKAWCLCATLAFLKKADNDEQKFFEQYRARGMIRAQSRLNNERWMRNVFHSDESVYVGKIFESITGVVRSFRVQQARNFGLKKHQKRPVNDTMTFSKTFYYALQVLNLPIVPELYVQDDMPGGLNFAITEPMASVCGASLLTGYSPQDLLFIVTRHLNYYRPEHYIRWVLPTQGELKTLLLSAMKIGMPEFKLPDDKSGVLKQYVRQMSSRMQPMELEALSKVVRRFAKSGETLDIARWINAVELTGCRAGFLMCNDLEIAARLIQADTGAVDQIPAKDKIKELVVFSVSEDYFKLREALGITIATG